MPLTPAVPSIPDTRLPLRAFLRAMRTNVLTTWPSASYREPWTVRRVLGRTHVTLAGPQAVHHVLVANAANYRRSPASVRILRPVTGNGLLLSEGEAWKLQRRTIAPALAPRVMPMLARHVAAAAAAMADRLAARTNRPLDLLGTMQALALDIAGRSMFSLEMERHGRTLRTLLAEFADRYAKPGPLDLLLPPSFPTPADRGRIRFRRRWMGFVRSLIAERLAMAQPETPRDLFDLLRAARDPETGAGFSADELRDQVATLILAGHETTAVTLFWALIMLAQSPEDQDWLAEETAALPLAPESAFAAMEGLPRTRAVVNETLRLFPPAYLIVREAIGPDRIGDLAIRRRTLVMIPPWVMHRHHASWDAPDVFLPVRFLPDRPAPPRFAFMPFGAGPRVCVGAQFAMTEAVLVLAMLSGRFRVERTEARPVLPVGIVTTQPDHAAEVRLVERA